MRFQVNPFWHYDLPRQGFCVIIRNKSNSSLISSLCPCVKLWFITIVLLPSGQKPNLLFIIWLLTIHELFGTRQKKSFQAQRVCSLETQAHQQSVQPTLVSRWAVIRGTVRQVKHVQSVCGVWVRQHCLTPSAGKSVIRTMCLYREAEVAFLQLLLRELNIRLQYSSVAVPGRVQMCCCCCHCCCHCCSCCCCFYDWLNLLLLLLLVVVMATLAAASAGNVAACPVD